MDDSYPLSTIDLWQQDVAEEILTDFLEAMPAHAALLDQNGTIITVNKPWRAFASSYGGADGAYVGANYLTVTGATDDPDALMVAGGLVAVMKGGLSNFSHDYPCHDANNQRWFRCLISPLRHDGRVKATVVMHIDISAQKRAEALAQAANRAKSEFLANLSHELRTPLNAIIGFSEIMMMGSDHYREYAGDVHTAGKHLLSLINEVLDLSKVEAGKYVLREEPVILAEIVGQSLHLVEAKATDAGLTLAAHAEGSLPALVADARLIRQILLNLLSNAIKFTPPGGIVSTSVAVADDGWMEIAVTDTGIGIDADDIARVMEPFGQIDSELARAHVGESTGLGLPLVKSFVELHQGELVVKSARGQGTRVIARFPPRRVKSLGYL
ncbi:PAS domain-containing sensor histidine kinase [Magnetospirillum sp. LM-5]|uniref:PAS domain-containing sensor histidine kinase n=1 Tax=Magnetospirillum sp. LM-5 TaxID=2681466 RepID=UPI0015702210|nr:PAS domain-containing sensor histidine kinase [Magnetospirillum sp. LM-5]